MNRTVLLRPEAEADVQETVADLELRATGLGPQFVARLRHVLERLERTPELYAPAWQDVRAVRLKRFQHIVYYLIVADRVEVLAVMHAARDSAAWQTRTNS